MSTPDQQNKPRLHPGHHWVPFADDPWSPDLDPVIGAVWEQAARAGRTRSSGLGDDTRWNLDPASTDESGA